MEDKTMAIETKIMEYVGKNREGQVGPVVKVEIEKLSSVLARLEDVAPPKPWTSWKDVLVDAHSTHSIEQQNKSRNAINGSVARTKAESKYE
jgi:hypothetical protein